MSELYIFNYILLYVIDYTVFFFFVLENRSEPNIGVDFWVQYLNCNVDFWVEYLNYSNGGRILQVQFCVQTNCGCW